MMQDMKAVPIGTTVVLKGLINCTEYNGKRAKTCALYDVKSGKYHIKIIESGKDFDIRPIYFDVDTTDRIPRNQEPQVQINWTVNQIVACLRSDLLNSEPGIYHAPSWHIP